MVVPGERSTESASLATALLLVLVVAAWLVPAPEPAVVGAPHLLAFFGGDDYDARWQRLAHVALLAAVAVAFLVGARRPALPLAARGLWKLGVAALLAVQVASFLDRPVMVAFTAATVAAAWLHHRGALPFGRPVQAVAYALVGLVWFAPVWLAPLDLSAVGDAVLVYVDVHYGAVVDPGHRVALGARPFHDVAVFYGAGPLGCVAALDRWLGSATAGRDVALIALSQVVAALLLVGAARPWRAFGAWGAFAALAAFPAASNALFMPNVSGLRFVGLAGVALALAHVHRLPPAVAPWALGLAAGLALAWNPETGLAAVGGVVGWSVGRLGLSPRGLSTHAVALGLGIAGGLALAAGAGRLVVGVPLVSDPSNLLFFAKGGFGQPLAVSPVVLGAAAHAASVLFDRAARPGAGSPGAARRVALASMLVVWLGYYANRPDRVNEVTYLALWALLVGESWPAVRRSVGRGARPAVAAAALCVLLPGMLGTYQAQLQPAISAWSTAISGPADPDAQRLSGVWVPRHLADHVNAQAVAVAPSDRFWLSGHAWLLARSVGRYPELPVSSPFGDTRTADDLASRVAEAMAQPDLRLHDPADPHLPAPVAAFFAHIAARLRPTHEATPADRGWIRLRRADRP